MSLRTVSIFAAETDCLYTFDFSPFGFIPCKTESPIKRVSEGLSLLCHWSFWAVLIPWQLFHFEIALNLNLTDCPWVVVYVCS